ncbi:TPA: glucosamine 6-phosphate synthetase, partial [Vibrio cholerae]|nr:glucosamine 6-phosphate synthetase [Vibrio cholerae]
WRWDEKVIDDTLFNVYDWEKAIDTSTTWRIGDGTAAFYNYVYYTVAGFTEHDTFRSNQIREGDLTRDEALKLVAEENKPRYPNIRWYLDTLGLDFKEVISLVNKIPKLYQYK